MTLTKLFVLALFVLLAYPVSLGNNGWATLAVIVVLVGSPVVYVGPALIAWTRDHPQTTAISVVNVLLGWSIVGWVVALAWAHTRKAEVLAQVTSMPAAEPAKSSSSYLDKLATAAAAAPAPPPAAVWHAMKKCPFCAEDIRAEAIKCKHCGSDLTKLPA